MAIDDKIGDKNLKYDINREAAKTSALSYSKIDKYEHLTGEEILPLDQRKVIKQTKFTYFSLAKDKKNQDKDQVKTIEDNRKQLVESKKKLSKRVLIVLILTEIVYQLKNKEIFNKRVEESSSEFRDLKK